MQPQLNRVPRRNIGPVRSFAVGGGLDTNAYGSWGAGTEGANTGGYNAPVTGAVTPTGSPSTPTATPTATPSTTGSPSTPTAMGGVAGFEGVGQYAYDSGGTVGQGDYNAPSGGDYSQSGDQTGSGDSAIPSDQTSSGEGNDDQPGSSSNPVDALLDSVFQALSTSRQQNGLSDAMFAGNIPTKPAGPGGDQTQGGPQDRGNQVSMNIPAQPAGPGGDQPGNNPFPTKTPAIPFGKKSADASDQDDSDQGVQGAAKGGAIDEALPDPAHPPMEPYRTKWRRKNGVKSFDDGGSTDDDTGIPVDDNSTDSGPAEPATDSEEQNAAGGDGGPQPSGTAPSQPPVAGQSGLNQDIESNLQNASTPQPMQGQNPGESDINAMGMDANPQKMIMKYLTGGGAIPQPQLKQMEQQIDPQGALNPTERTMRTIAAAQKESPQAGAAAIQAYRQQYDTLKGGAAAALSGTKNSPPNLITALQNATLAYSNVPDGSNIAFMPGPDNNSVVAHVRPLGKAASTVNLTIPQFNAFLKGPQGTFDNLMETSSSVVLQQLAKSGGVPVQPIPQAPQRGRNVIPGNQVQPMGQQASTQAPGPMQPAAPVQNTNAPTPGPAPQYNPQATNPNADFGQGNQIVQRTPSPMAGTPAGASSPASAQGGRSQPITTAQNNGYSNWMKAQQERNAALSGNKYQPGPNGTLRAQTFESAGTQHPMFAGPNKLPPDPFTGYDKDDVARAKQMFTQGASQNDILRQQINWLEGQKQQKTTNEINTMKAKNPLGIAQIREKGYAGRTDTVAASKQAQIASNERIAGARNTTSANNAQTLATSRLMNSYINNGSDIGNPQVQQNIRQLAAISGVPPQKIVARLPQLAKQNQNQSGQNSNFPIRTLKDGRQVQQQANGGWKVISSAPVSPQPDETETEE